MFWKMKFKAETEIIVEADNITDAIEKGTQYVRTFSKFAKNELDWNNFELQPKTLEVINE